MSRTTELLRNRLTEPHAQRSTTEVVNDSSKNVDFKRENSNKSYQQVHNGYAKLKSFPGCNSKEMSHYIEPTLETGFHDSAILHVGVNDLLNDKSPSSTDNVVSNLLNLVNKFKSFGVMDLFVSGILFNKDSHTLSLKTSMKKL